MRKTILAVILAVAIAALGGCGNSYTESDMESARQQGYSEGYSEGYRDGYDQGAEDRRDEDYDELLIDGRSIRNIQDQVYDMYGLTPSQAFGIVDEYEYDSTHGGFTWSEYQNALEAVYYTASIFPQDY